MAARNKKTRAPQKTATIAAAPARPSRWPWLVGAAVVAAIVFELYGPALNGPFLLDDTYLPYDLPSPPATLMGWIAGVRPLLMFSYWLNFRVAGGDTFAYHATNVILHLLNGGLVWLIMRRLLERVQMERWLRETLAAFAAVLFLVHPLNTESVSYIASRSETLSVFFFYLAFAIFLYRPNGAISFARTAAVLLAFAAACLTKEHAAVLPLLLLLTDYWWNPGFSLKGIRANWRLYVPMVVMGILGGAWVVNVLAHAQTAGFHVRNLPWYHYFLTECRAIWMYLLMYVIPAGQNIDHQFSISNGILVHGAIFGLLGLAAATAAAWYWRKRFPLASYGWFVLLLLLAPTSSFVPIADVLVERRVYLPFIGLLLITVDLLRRWRASRQVFVGVLAGILVVEGALTYQRNRLWGDDIAMWTDSAAKSPAKRRPRFQLARVLYGYGKCADAASEYNQAAKLGPPDEGLLVDWGLAESCAQQPQAAVEKIKEAIRLRPNAHAWTQLAMVYGQNGQYDEALAALASAQTLRPNYDMIYFYRGTVFVKEQKPELAIAEYRHGLALNPENTAIRNALAQLGQPVPPR